MRSRAPSETIWGHIGVPIPSIDSSRSVKLLPFVLAFVAGSVDVIRTYLKIAGCCRSDINAE
jgi:hypothetical protein